MPKVKTKKKEVVYRGASNWYIFQEDADKEQRKFQCIDWKLEFNETCGPYRVVVVQRWPGCSWESLGPDSELCSSLSGRSPLGPSPWPPNSLHTGSLRWTVTATWPSVYQRWPSTWPGDSPQSLLLTPRMDGGLEGQPAGRCTTFGSCSLGTKPKKMDRIGEVRSELVELKMLVFAFTLCKISNPC